MIRFAILKLRERFSHNGRSNRVQKKKWSEAEKEIHMPEDFTHAYCDYCETIQPVKREKLENEDTSGQFEGRRHTLHRVPVNYRDSLCAEKEIMKIDDH